MKRTKWIAVSFLAASCLGHAMGVDDFRAYRVLDESDMRNRFARYALGDAELYTNAYCNAVAFDFLKDAVPRFECPDEDITETYYFRWWIYRKHLKKTSLGWVVTEFLPDVEWAGKNNTIACPLGHQIREGRWLSDDVYLDDYIRFMLTEGTVAGPRAYVNWPAWSALERAKVTGDDRFVISLLPKFVANYENWEKGWNWGGSRIRAGLQNGLFLFLGDREGTELALSADGARPMVNAAMWAEADAIAKIAHKADDGKMADEFAKKAKILEGHIKNRLWNRERGFFTTELADGRQDSVCELHGYAPFYFGMPLDPDYGVSWKSLLEEEGFLAPRGLVFPRRDTPGFIVSHDCRQHECQWNGPSWPYATSIALTALYETLQRGFRLPLEEDAFSKLLGQYAAQHRLVRDDGTVVPWIDENYDPFEGVWLARKLMIDADRKGVRKLRYAERGKDYNHSTFCDLVIAGICGLVPQDGKEIVVKPLAPKSWDWWCVDGVRYRDKNLTILFDRSGERYGKGKGLVVLGGDR